MFDIIPTASASHCKIFSLRVHRFYFYVLFPPSLSFFIYIYIYFLSYLSSILSLLSIDCAMLDLQISFLFFLSFLYIYKYTYIYIYIHTRQKVGQFKGWGEIVMQCLNNVQVSQCAFIKREAVWKEKKERHSVILYISSSFTCFWSTKSYILEQYHSQDLVFIFVNLKKSGKM